MPYAVGYIAIACLLYALVAGGGVYHTWVSTQRLPLLSTALWQSVSDWQTLVQVFSGQVMALGQVFLGLEFLEHQGSLYQTIAPDWFAQVLMGYRDMIRSWWWLHLGVGTGLTLVAGWVGLRVWNRPWLGHPWVCLSAVLFISLWWDSVQSMVLLRVLPLAQQGELHHTMASLLPWLWVWVAYGAMYLLHKPLTQWYQFAHAGLKRCLPMALLGATLVSVVQLLIFHLGNVYLVAKDWHEHPQHAQHTLLALTEATARLAEGGAFAALQSNVGLPTALFAVESTQRLVATVGKGHESHALHRLQPLRSVATSLQGMTSSGAFHRQEPVVLLPWQRELRQRLRQSPQAMVLMPRGTLFGYQLGQGLGWSQQVALQQQERSLPEPTLPIALQKEQFMKARWVLLPAPTDAALQESIMVWRSVLAQADTCFYPRLWLSSAQGEAASAVPSLWENRCIE
jgi:hypothetical protein